MADFYNTDDPYTSDLGSFSGRDPEVDPEKVNDYVAWKRSRICHPLYRYAWSHHWRCWYTQRVDDRWFMTPWYVLLELVMRHTRCNNMRGTLNRYELIRAGLELGQYQADYNSGWRGYYHHTRVALNG